MQDLTSLCGLNGRCRKIRLVLLPPPVTVWLKPTWVVKWSKNPTTFSLVTVQWLFHLGQSHLFCMIFLSEWLYFILAFRCYFVLQIRDRFVKEPAFEDITLESERKRIFKDFMHVLEVIMTSFFPD